MTRTSDGSKEREKGKGGLIERADSLFLFFSFQGQSVQTAAFLFGFLFLFGKKRRELGRDGESSGTEPDFFSALDASHPFCITNRV